MSKQIVKSNHIIKAAYRLSLNEQRLILLCIEQIRKGQAVSKQDVFTVTAAEITEAFSISIDRAYTVLQEVADRLYERSLLIYQEDSETSQNYTKTRWISAIDYIRSESKIRLYFAPKVIPYISLLESGFTRYNLEYIAPMTSAYGIRFYELLKFWLMGNSEKVKNIDLDELKELLGIEGLYSSIKDFKVYVIDRGLVDVNEHTDLNVSYANKKTGRKVTGLEFTITQKWSKPANSQLGTHKEALSLPIVTSKPDAKPTPITSKAEDKASPLYSLEETRSRLKGAKDLANAVGATIETYLTEKDRSSIAHYKLVI